MCKKIASDYKYLTLKEIKFTFDSVPNHLFSRAENSAQISFSMKKSHFTTLL